MMNVAMLSGFLRACDPIQTRNGGTIARFVVEYQEKIKDTVKSHKIEFSAFGNTATQVLSTPLGSRIMIRGVMEENRYTGRDGQERSFLKLSAQMIEVLHVPDTIAVPAPPEPPPPPPQEKPASGVLPGMQGMTDDGFHDEIPF